MCEDVVNDRSVFPADFRRYYSYVSMTKDRLPRSGLTGHGDEDRSLELARAVQEQDLSKITPRQDEAE